MMMSIIASIVAFTNYTNPNKSPIKVGIIDTSSTLPELSSSSVIDAINMAIDDLNEQGGVLNHPIIPIKIIHQPTDDKFIDKFDQLLEKEQLRAVFGCQTSYVRKKIEPLAKKHRSLIIYSSLYKGLEQSNNIIYAGALPNQIITPTVKWGVENFGKRVLLVGTDYVFSHAANTFITRQLQVLGAENIDIHYLPFGSMLTDELSKELSENSYDMVLSTLVGSSNMAFLKYFSEKSIDTPLVTFDVSEEELHYLRNHDIKNFYLGSNYFEQLPSENNRAFLKKFKDKYGQHRHITPSMVAAYTGVKIWAKTVAKIKTIDPSSVMEALKGESYASPEGLVSVSTMNNHFWKKLYIAKLQGKPGFVKVYHQDMPIRPLPFPSYGTQYKWRNFLSNLYKEKGGVMPIPIVSKDKPSQHSHLEIKSKVGVINED